MHIIIDAHLAVEKIDGVARYLIGLLKELPKLERSFRFTVLALPDHKSGLPAEIFDRENVKKVTLDLMGPSPRQHFILPRMLSELKADLYHHPQFDLPRRVKIPTVVTIHDLKYIFYPDFLDKKSRLKQFYIKKSLKYSLENATRIISVSNSTLNDLQRFYPLDSSRVKVIPHGVYPPNNTNVTHEKLNIDFERDFVLFVGTRRPHKNIQGLIQALAILRDKFHLNTNLVVSGKAYSDYTEPEELAARLDLNDRVNFLDFVPDDQLSALYRMAKVVALPSFYEGFGFPLVEAMSYGKPVVGSNVTSMPEVVGDAGLLVDPANPEDIAEKLHNILTDKELAQRLSQKALERTQLFSWTAVARSTLKVYEQALRDAQPS